MSALVHHVRPLPAPLGGQLKQHEASSELFTPMQLDRFTINPSKYDKYRSYLLQSSTQHDNENESSSRVYDVTSLKRSDVRMNDQLLPAAPDAEMNRRQIDAPFPQHHPYTSHVSQLSVFPDFRSPDDPHTGDPSRCPPPLKIGKAANAFDVRVDRKTKGYPYRYEVQQNPTEGEKSALRWTGEEGFNQLKKSDLQSQQYFPTPTKLVHPNLRLREEDQRIELRTANCLRNIEREQQITSYDYDYTGLGRTVKLDDHHDKMKTQIREGHQPSSAQLKTISSGSFSLSRPLEGRRARILQQRKHLVPHLRYPEDHPSPDAPDVMDSPTHIPAHQISTGSDEEGKQMEEHHRPVSADLETLQLDGVRAEKEKSYLEVMQEARNKKFQEIDDKRRERELHLLYGSKQDLLQLRHKVDQFGVRDGPRAVNYHNKLIHKDREELAKLGQVSDEGKFPSSGLKYSTEKITNCGQLDSLHERQAAGYELYSHGFVQDIPLTDPPRQNHGSATSRNYVTKTNPYSMSSRGDHGECDRMLNSGTGGRRTSSILRLPGAPPHSGVSTNISFNEVVKVASSEYGERFSLQNIKLTDDASCGGVLRPSTPSASRMRAREEPSIYRGINFNSPTLRPITATDQPSIIPKYQDNWRVNYIFEDGRSKSASTLAEMQNNWNKTKARRSFHENFPENAPDMRLNVRRGEFADEGADLRLTHSIQHREKRHSFLGYNAYYLHNGSPMF